MLDWEPSFSWPGPTNVWMPLCRLSFAYYKRKDEVSIINRWVSSLGFNFYASGQCIGKPYIPPKDCHCVHWLFLPLLVVRLRIRQRVRIASFPSLWMHKVIVPTCQYVPFIEPLFLLLLRKTVTERTRSSFFPSYSSQYVYGWPTPSQFQLSGFWFPILSLREPSHKWSLTWEKEVSFLVYPMSSTLSLSSALQVNFEGTQKNWSNLILSSYGTFTFSSRTEREA